MSKKKLFIFSYIFNAKIGKNEPSLHFNKVPIIILHKSSNITTAILTQLDLPADKYPNQYPSHSFLIKKKRKEK